VCLGDVGVLYQERQARFGNLLRHFETLGDDVRRHLEASRQGDRGDGGALVYVFETPEGTVLYQDTSGHWSGILHDLRPDVAILAAAGRGNVDGEPVQGTLAQFVARQAWLLKPRRVVLAHHDNWLPGFSTATDVEPIRTEISRWAPGATLEDLTYLDGHKLFR
jgi:L-ascorbate metabolism protein UlaG (beta-lactamase superfamily)